MTGVTHSDNWKPRFFLIWGGQAFSLIGSALTQFVLLWWIADTTGSVSALAVAGVMAMLPQALLGPLGGTLADRWNRRAIMIIADSVTALCMVALITMFMLGEPQLLAIYTLMFVRSSMQAFQQPAAAASTAMLVPEDWLTRAAGLNQTVFGLMSIVSAPLGALALTLMPLPYALMIDVATALLGITPLFIYRIPQIRVPRESRTSIVSELKSGVRYVAGHRGLLMMAILNGLVVLTIMPAFSLTPLLIKEWFGGGINEVALMEAVGGIGMIAGGILISFWPGFKRRIVTSLLGFAIACGTIALAALSPSNMLYLAAFWWFVSGVTVSMGNAPSMAIIQSVVPNQMQGRVLSLFSTVMGLAGPLGLALAAPLGEVTGVRGVFIIGGTLAALVNVAGFLSPSLMRIEDGREQGTGSREQGTVGREQGLDQTFS